MITAKTTTKITKIYMSEASISQTLKDLLKSKSISANKLATLTDVPHRFIDAILKEDFDQLPARPYIRGYLFKISDALGAGSDELWEVYRASADSASSGDRDTLPANRFALKRLSPGVVVGGITVVVLLVLLGMNLNHILGKPTIDINVPEATTEDTVTVTGIMNPNDRLTLNEEIIYTNDAGEFEREVQLEPGLNSLEFKVSRYLGRETTIIRQVIYQPQFEINGQEEG